MFNPERSSKDYFWAFKARAETSAPNMLNFHFIKYGSVFQIFRGCLPNALKLTGVNFENCQNQALRPENKFLMRMLKDWIYRGAVKNA